MKLKLWRSTVNVVYIPPGANAPISEFKHHVFTEKPTEEDNYYLMIARQQHSLRKEYLKNSYVY